MSERKINFLELVPLAVSVICLVCVGAVFLQPVLQRAFRGASDREFVVEVKGLKVPRAPGEDYILYTDRGEFVLSDRLRFASLRDDPWFAFRIGEKYRVRTRSERNAFLRGDARTVVAEAHRLSESAYADVGRTEHRHPLAADQ